MMTFGMTNVIRRKCDESTMHTTRKFIPQRPPLMVRLRAPFGQHTADIPRLGAEQLRPGVAGRA